LAVSIYVAPHVYLPHDRIYCTKLRAQKFTYNAVDVFELLNYHDQELMLDLDETAKQRALEEVGEPKPRPKEQTMTVLKLTEGLGLIEPGITVFDDSGFNEQQEMRILTWYEETLKENRPVSRQSSVLNLKASPETRASRPVLLNAGDNDPDDPPRDHEEMCLP